MSQAENKVIPEGYKQTEVGVIPEDWECISFGNLGDVVRGGSPRPAGDPKYFNGKYIPWLTVASLTNIKASQQYVKSTKTMLTELGSLQSRTLDKNTLIISNSGATLGVAKILGIKCCANDGVAALINQKKGINSFLVHYLNTQTKRLHDDIATGNGQPNLNTDLIKLIPIPYPSEKEQTAIANALSNVDALLSELDKLIAKKQAIKTATMQQLLTGKTRLPQFAFYSDINSTEGAVEGKRKGTKPSELGEIPDDWEVTSVASLCEIATGSTPPTNDVRNYGGEYLFISPADLKGQKYVDKSIKLLSKEGWSICRKFPPNSILFTCIGSTIGKCGLTRNWTTSNQQINAIFPSEKINFDYLYYQLAYAAPRIKEQAGEQAVPIINKTEFGKSLIYRSQHAEEQTAIATILSIWITKSKPSNSV